MPTAWTYDGAPDPLDPGQVTAVEGSAFCISDHAGNIDGQRTDGLIVRDTRVLSRWHLTVSDHSPEPLTVNRPDPFSATFVGLLRKNGAQRPHDLLVVRHRFVGNGMREEIWLHNPGAEPMTVRADLRVGADFADLFEVKDGHADGASPQPGSDIDGDLVITTGHGHRLMKVTVGSEPAGEIDPGLIRWQVTVPARGSWMADVEVTTHILGQSPQLAHPRGTPIEHAALVQRHRSWQESLPVAQSRDPSLTATVQASVRDLGTLRIFDPDQGDDPVVAAGSPWFMALFGRDALITAIMLLPFEDTLARGTLRTLAAHQGRRADAMSEEEPGRILHELRFGPASTLALGGQGAYYGSVDSTPLFVMLLGELLRWKGPAAISPDLIASADAALAWMTSADGPDRDGFLRYERKTDQGLVNQGWKDSGDGINFADGEIAQAPIALAEVQGYAYAAYRARAEIAHAIGESHEEGHWTERAAALKEAFNETFWLPDLGWYAVGLDRDNRPIDALTSNIGHLLWTGIADADKAVQVAGHLLSPAMFTGWGIRTLSSDMAAYDPLSYHNGSVWPHDTAICVAGLARYGHPEAAGRVALGLLDAIACFGHTPPELFAGFPRDVAEGPIPYPAACSPQAWASAAPIEVLRALLGLEPGRDGLMCGPTVPARLLPLTLTDIVCRGEHYTIEVHADTWSLTPNTSQLSR